jgi:hypothetical protein
MSTHGSDQDVARRRTKGNATDSRAASNGGKPIAVTVTPKLHAPFPWRVDEMGNYIWAADNTMLFQIRGWGHLTGKGGGLGLSEVVAEAVQKHRAAFAVNAANNHNAMLEALKRARQELYDERHSSMSEPEFLNTVLWLDGAIRNAEAHS